MGAEHASSIDIVQAVFLCEGVEQAESEEHLIAAWQVLIDTGYAWSLQGSFGRTAQQLIDLGICTDGGR